MNVFSLILILIFSRPLKASVSLPEFETLSRDFVSFIVPHGKKVIDGYVKTIKLKKDKRDFGAFSTEPMIVHLGLLLSKPMTIDSVALVLCHEIGHDLKIANYYLPPNLNYSFSHLTQDYYASRVCISPFLKSSPSLSKKKLTSLELEEIPLSLQTRCELRTKSESDVQLCFRVIHASIRLIRGLYEDVFKSEYTKMKLPAPSVEREWLGPGDDLQARLITLINGVFSDLPFNRRN